MRRSSLLRSLVVAFPLAACDCEAWLATRRSGSLPPPAAAAVPERAALPSAPSGPAAPATPPSAPPPVALPPKRLVPPGDVARAIQAPPQRPQPTDENAEDVAEEGSAPAPRAAPPPMPPGMHLKLPGGFGRPQILRTPQFQVDPKVLHRP
jgi:hypothetical protein